jgi:hypothetical protein
MRAGGIEGPSLPAVADRAAEAFDGVRPEQIAPMGSPRVLGLFKTSPAHALVHVMHRSARQTLDPDLLRARRRPAASAPDTLDGAANRQNR